jgi:hypothetical protein
VLSNFQQTFLFAIGSGKFPDPKSPQINPGKNLRWELLTQNEEIVLSIGRIVVLDDSS